MKIAILIGSAFSSVLMNEMLEGGEGAAPAKVLTLSEKLAAKAQVIFDKVTGLTAEYNSVLAQLAAIEMVANVKAGDTAYGATGVGAKRQLVKGVVLGVSEDESGKQIKVQSGTGFDTTVFVLRAAQITSVEPAGAELELQASDEEVLMPAATPEFDAEVNQVV